MRTLIARTEGVEIYEDQMDVVQDALGISPEQREVSLMNFYSAERRAGTPPLEANELMHEFAKRLDNEESIFLRDLAIIKQCMERVS